MGVYKSKTKPEVRREAVKILLPAEHMTSLDDDAYFKTARRQYKIPAGVMPDLVESGARQRVYRFDWWVVETFC